MHAVIKRQSKSACCDGIIDVDSILKSQKYIRKRDWPTSYSYDEVVSQQM